MRRKFSALALALLLAACATEQGRVSTTTVQPPVTTTPDAGAILPGAGIVGAPGITRPSPALPNYPKSIQDSGATPGVLALYRQAQEARAAGHADQAEAALERALHLDPRNPFVWQALADAHLALNQADQAEAAAQKSTSLAHGNPYVEAGNWRLIAAARQARGDSDGALQAQARADDIARALAKTP
ncbi:MAG: tetratricopeptide repeat protein [Nevskia sp.]|nr:tetratricopeptide repeat protein [Nevskia sp.]